MLGLLVAPRRECLMSSVVIDMAWRLSEREEDDVDRKEDYTYQLWFGTQFILWHIRIQRK